MNIYQKLIEVRAAVPYLKKNNQGYKFNFVSSSQTLVALKRKMDELGLLLVPEVVKHDTQDHTTKKGDHQYFTVLTMKFVWINADKPEETIAVNWLGQGLDDGEKGVGKALTYAEKYFMLKFFNIPTDKDDPDAFQRKNATPEKITLDQCTQINDLIAEKGADKKRFLAFIKADKVENIRADFYQTAVKALEAKKK